MRERSSCRSVDGAVGESGSEVVQTCDVSNESLARVGPELAGEVGPVAVLVHGARA